MSNVSRDLSERICPGDRAETDWLETFEFLRARLSNDLATEVGLGCYCIDDFAGSAHSSGCARVRGRKAIPEIESDYWEGVLCWGGNRGENGRRAGVSIFPFLGKSAVTRRGRIADLGPAAEVDEFIAYQFQNGRFVNSGWCLVDGPGEWAEVTVPGTVYWQGLKAVLPSPKVAVNTPIFVELHIPHLSLVRTHPEPSSSPRISLVHVNRNRECTNLAPWTARPAKPCSQHTQFLADCSFPTNDVARFRLDSFNIRGGWTPGKYHLAIRIQNFHKPGDWTWSSDISKPFRVTIV